MADFCVRYTALVDWWGLSKVNRKELCWYLNYWGLVKFFRKSIIISVLFWLVILEVDSYMAKISLCLRDPCELVRRQTFILLSRLLQVNFCYFVWLLFSHFHLKINKNTENFSNYCKIFMFRGTMWNGGGCYSFVFFCRWLMNQKR